LELLELHQKIPYIYHDCATSEELEYFVNKWSLKRYQNFPILYFAFHGNPNEIMLGNKPYSLDQLADILYNKCKSSVIIFGSCSTLAIDKRHLNRFLKATGALAICGYKNSVDWLESTAFEMLLLNHLQENKFDGRGIASITIKVTELSMKFRNSLDFRIVSKINK
jgi:hypothetical protein